MKGDKKPGQTGEQEVLQEARVEKGDLAPDEAVLGNCKQSGSTSSSNIPTQTSAKYAAAP